MNLPNVLTLSRIVLAFFIVLLLMANTTAGFIAATVLFIVASLTDFYDGHLSKKMGLTSDFGKIMDPIADKVLMLSVFGALAHLGMIEWWMVIVIAVREILVTVSRLKAVVVGQVLAAENMGKIKTVCQIAAIGVTMLFLIVEQSAFAVGWFYQVEPGWRSLINVFMVASVFFTVGSGIVYFRNTWERSLS